MRHPCLLGVLAIASCAHAPAATSPATDRSPAITSAAASATAASAFRVEVSGHGPDVILIPGLASSGDVWDGTVARLRDRYTCHVLTLAGFAGVPAIDDPLLATARDQLAGYIAAHHVEHPVIIGHSLGGVLALELAAAHADAVGSLVIVDSLPFLAQTMLGVSSATEAAPIVDRMVRGIAAQPQQAYATRAGASARAMVTAPDDQQRVTAWSIASDRAAVAQAMGELLRTDLRPVLPSIHVPVLVIGTWRGWSTDSSDAARQETEAVFERQYAGLPQLHFAMADEARHFVMLDVPAWFFGQLEAFLADPDAIVRDRGFAAP